MPVRLQPDIDGAVGENWGISSWRFILIYKRPRPGLLAYGSSLEMTLK